MSHTVLQIPVPALESPVRRQLTLDEPALTLPDDETVCAHITALGPFVHERDVDDALLAGLTELLGSVEPFDYELVDVRRFPGGPTYLAPSPPEPFVQLTARLARAYPAWPPYGGAFDDVVPHLTLGAVSPQGAYTALDGALPLRARADEVHLTAWSPTSVCCLARFPLGGAGRDRLTPPRPQARG